jgi:uncharacterized membrane protein YcfT
MTTSASRVDWVDIAKGICIILVVMMHSTLGVEKSVGHPTVLNAFIEWARPFRMPDFFLISGLFLAARINRPWSAYLDTKVLHFAYFYVLWLTIQYAVKAPGMIAEAGTAATIQSYLLGYLDPFGTLWFIYLLAVFFIVAKLVHKLPAAAVLLVSAALHILAPKTGWIVADEFTDRFVFFYTGYALAPAIFAFANRVFRAPALLLAGGTGVWAVLNWLGVNDGIALTHGPDLLFSYVGIAAVIVLSVLLVRSNHAQALAYCGRHSIAIYLAFPLFMGPARVVLLKALGADYASGIAVASMAAGVIGALLMRHVLAGTPLRYLFVRPDAFKQASLARVWERAAGGPSVQKAGGPTRS